MRHLSVPRLAPLVAALLAGCAAPQPVHLSTDPPGARVLIDGVDSGFVTPCLLELPNVPERKVAFSLRGYESAERTLVYVERTEMVYWKDASTSANTWCFPIFLNPPDFFVPIKSKSGESPSRIFVRLRREADRSPG